MPQARKPMQYVFGNRYRNIPHNMYGMARSGPG